MARLSPAALVPALVGALAVVAWVASPQHATILDRAADALEEAGTATIRTEVRPPGTPPLVTVLEVDFERQLVVIDDPEPGVEQRVITPGAVSERLTDGTWIQLVEPPPPLFGQDVVAQLRTIDAVVEPMGDGRYRLRFRHIGGDASGELHVDDAGLPRRFTSTYELAGRQATLGWELLRVGHRLDVDVPADAAVVDAGRRAALLEGRLSSR